MLKRKRIMKNLNLFMCCAFAVMSCSSDFPTYNDIKKQPEPVQAKTANEFLNSMGVCAGIDGRGETVDRKSTRLNSSHPSSSRMPSSA